MKGQDDDLLGGDAILQEALAFWRENRRDAGLPTRAEIDPLNIPRSLFPYLILADVLSPDGFMRFRLVGARMRDKWGADFNGKTSQEIFTGSYRQYIEGAFAQCIRDELPVYSESHFRWDVDGYRRTRRLMLPIADEAHGGTRQILVVQTWPDSAGDSDGDDDEPVIVAPRTIPMDEIDATASAVAGHAAAS